MRLEQFLSDDQYAPTPEIAALRARAFAPDKYILVDPVTLCLPLLLGNLRGSFDVQDNAGYRSRAVLASIQTLIQYGSELTQLIRQRLSEDLQREAEPWLMDHPSAFLPPGMRGLFSHGLTGVEPQQIVGRRLEKEQVRATGGGGRARTCVCVRARTSTGTQRGFKSRVCGDT